VDKGYILKCNKLLEIQCPSIWNSHAAGKNFEENIPLLYLEFWAMGKVQKSCDSKD
jgi:hypothetical protein